MPWMQAKSYCAEISTAKLHYEMPTPQEMTNILRGRDLFNQTVAILQQNGIAAAPINGANYWTNAYDWCDCYFAIVQKTLQKKAYSGQTNLAFRAVLHLCPLTQK